MPPIKLSKISFPPQKPKGDAEGLVAASTGEDVPVGVEVPSDLVDQFWAAVDADPDLTIDKALTLALQQYLASLPAGS